MVYCWFYYFYFLRFAKPLVVSRCHPSIEIIVMTGHGAPPQFRQNGTWVLFLGCLIYRELGSSACCFGADC